jgi:hypothetical protein
MMLPESFTHTPPKGYSYEVKQHKQSVLSIWICDHSEYVYNSGAINKCIWGFYNTRKHTYFAPIDSKRPGKVVKFANTRPYTSMQLDLGPLAAILC